jgi:hypothetical protein
MDNRHHQCGHNTAAFASKSVELPLDNTYGRAKGSMITSENAAMEGVTRRTFGKLTATGLFAVAVPLHASTKLDIGIGASNNFKLSRSAAATSPT